MSRRFSWIKFPQIVLHIFWESCQHYRLKQWHTVSFRILNTLICWISLSTCMILLQNRLVLVTFVADICTPLEKTGMFNLIQFWNKWSPMVNPVSHNFITGSNQLSNPLSWKIYLHLLPPPPIAGEISKISPHGATATKYFTKFIHHIHVWMETVHNKNDLLLLLIFSNCM